MKLQADTSARRAAARLADAPLLGRPASELIGGLSPHNEQIRAMAARIVGTHPPHPRYDFDRLAEQPAWLLERRARDRAHRDFFETWCERVKLAHEREARRR